MVRTKADSSARKAVAAKAPRKVLGASGGGGGGAAGASMMSPKGSKYAGGNSVCERPTPDWQKDISSFFGAAPQRRDKENTEPLEGEEEGAGPAGNVDGGSSSSSSGSQSSNAEGLGCEALEADDDEPAGSTSSKPNMKRNGLIDSDDED